VLLEVSLIDVFEGLFCSINLNILYMNHYVIMTVYRDLSMINKVVEHIPNDWGIYIHIDMKSNIDISQIHRGIVKS